MRGIYFLASSSRNRRNSFHLIEKPKADCALILYHNLYIRGPFYGYLKILKLCTWKSKSRNKHFGPHLGSNWQLGTSRTERKRTSSTSLLSLAMQKGYGFDSRWWFYIFHQLRLSKSLEQIKASTLYWGKLTAEKPFNVSNRITNVG